MSCDSTEMVQCCCYKIFAWPLPKWDNMLLHPPKWCLHTTRWILKLCSSNNTKWQCLSCFSFDLSIRNMEALYFRSNFINLNICRMTIWVRHLTLIWRCRTSLPYSDGTILGTRCVGFSTRGKSNTMHRSMMTFVARCIQTQELSIMNKLWRRTCLT